MERLYTLWTIRIVSKSLKIYPNDMGEQFLIHLYAKAMYLIIEKGKNNE